MIKRRDKKTGAISFIPTAEDIEKQRYEIEKQQKLRDTMKALDNFEHILAEQEKAKKSQKTTDINKKGGNNIG